MPISGLFAISYPPPIPCLLLCFRSPAGRKRPFPVPGHLSFRSVPYPVLSTRKHLDLPSSRATPVSTCPGLRPRWSPGHSPLRVQDCCLPVSPNCRLSLLQIRRISLRSTTIHISGLNAEPAPLIPSGFGLPLLGWPSDFTTGLVVSL